MLDLILAVALPIQDYALRQYIEWREHPSPENYTAFLEKQRQERAVRLLIAVPFGVMAVLLAVRLTKNRRSLRRQADSR